MLKNKVKISFDEIAGLFGKTLLLNVGESDTFEGITSDSREVEKSSVFIALKGENLDGHEKIADAFSRGAGLAVIEREWFKNHQSELDKYPLLIVRSTLNALHNIANYHRNKFDIPVIAIGGSNGKTTTKELTAHVISSKYNVLKTYENFNNQIGVPLMLLQINDETQLAVIEMGTNEPGEIKILSSLVEPTHGLITNIGREHLEKLIDLDGVELEETLLFGELYKSNGMAFINVDDERLRKYESFLENKICFGQSGNADIQGIISLDDEIRPIIKMKINGESRTVRMKTSGFTTGLNAICAAAIASSFNFTPDEIADALESYEAKVTHGYARMTLENIGGVRLINDCYNANPDSMKAAMNTFEQIKTLGRKILVLGDMRELGEASFGEHTELLARVSHLADEIYITGDEMKKAWISLIEKKNIMHFDSKQELAENLIDVLRPDDFVLVKGSRGMKMEQIIDEIKNNLND